ncbi:MAG: T9SS type A sorting domain-containing protein [Bacteroidia bacterium]|nr:T9SS type A sorting domain-containing protein [Bacteroidia bacterium]
MRAFILSIFLTLSISSFAQGWAKHYQEGSQFMTQAFDVEPHPAGGVLILMYNDSLVNIPLLYRVDQNGQLLWIKQPMDTNTWFSWDQLLYHDSAYYLFVNRGYAFDVPMTTVKMNLNGDTLWTRKDSIPGWGVENYGSDVRANGNILVCTKINDWSTQTYIRMVEMDTSGNIVWDSTYTSMSVSLLMSSRLRCTADGGFYLHYYAGPNRGAYRFSATGAIIDTLQSTSNYPIFLEVFPTSDTGSLVITNDNPWQYRFLRLTANGDTVWNQLTDTMRNVGWPNILETPDGGIIIGFQGLRNNCERVPSMMKIDSTGNIEWFNEYNSAGQGNEVYFVLDGTAGYYYVGRTAPCYFTVNSLTRTLVVRFDSLGRVYSNNLSGNIFYDNASDCVFNSPDTYSQNWLVEANGNSGPFYAVTDSLGNYSMNVSTGSYTITQHINPSRIPVCPVSPNTHTVNFTTTDSSIAGLDFANIFIPNQPDLAVNLIAFNRFRPGGDVDLRISCKNNGSTVLNGNITAIHDTFLTSSNYNPAPLNTNSGSITWSYSNLQPDDELIINFRLHVAISAVQGQAITITASAPVSNDINPVDNNFQWTDSVRTSYDPNDKNVFPVGWGAEGYIYANQELTYVVRFQNTGTDTAFRIVVSDQINSLLDLSTFQFVSSSHYCTTEISQAGEVQFVFNNILLPDSNTNEALSHGFVCFKIKPKSSVLPEDVIVNGAAIYFDYNDPVFTNQTLNTIADPNSVQEVVTPNRATVKVYPNPASESTTFHYDGIDNRKATLKIWNVQGQLIQEHALDNSGQFKLITSILDPGMYLWTIETGSNVEARDRLLIAR